MKKTITALAVVAICTMLACTKESGLVNRTPEPAAETGNMAQYGMYGHSNARLSGTNYSHSITVDSANKMIQSYLTGVGYPSFDTAIRALSFDADTLRAYLANPDIVTIKFLFAHQTNYINSGHYGTNSGLNPGAITLVIAGLNDNEEYVRNNQNGFYDNQMPCPYQCPASALVQ